MWLTHSEWSRHSTSTAHCTERTQTIASGSCSTLPGIRQILPPLVYPMHSSPGVLWDTAVDFQLSSRCEMTSNHIFLSCGTVCQCLLVVSLGARVLPHQDAIEVQTPLKRYSAGASFATCGGKGDAAAQRCKLPGSPNRCCERALHHVQPPPRNLHHHSIPDHARPAW